MSRGKRRSEEDWPRSSLAHSKALLTDAALVLDVDAYGDLHAAIHELLGSFSERATAEGWRIGPVCQDGHEIVLMDSEGTHGPTEVWRCPTCGRPEVW